MATKIKPEKWPWPPNVGVLGTYPEEVNRGKVEKNLDASPLAHAEPEQFLAPRGTSEALRIGDPKVPLELAEAMVRPLIHVIFRRILSKTRRRGVVLFDDAVEEEDLADLPPGRREQMRTMLLRERAMLEILDRYNALAEDVYMRLLANSKG